MWIASTLGWFSIVKKGAPTEWQVRARQRGDLESLLAACGWDEDDVPIVRSPTNDYRFRVIVTRARLAKVFGCLLETIRYGNFKQAIAETPGQRGKLAAYHNIWAVMRDTQANGRPLAHAYEVPEDFSTRVGTPSRTEGRNCERAQA